MAVSLAKVADVDRALGNESAACEGFQEAVKKLEGLSMPKNSENSALAKRVMSSFKKLSKSVSLFSFFFHVWFFFILKLFLCSCFLVSLVFSFSSCFFQLGECHGQDFLLLLVSDRNSACC